MTTRAALLLVFLCALAVAPVTGCVPTTVTEEPDPSPATSTIEPAPEPARDPDAPPLVVGVAEEDLVLYDPVTGEQEVLVPDVGKGGVLHFSPDGAWMAHQSTRRWDGLDTTEVVFINLATYEVRFLSEAEGLERYEFNIEVLGWTAGRFLYTDEGAYSPGGRGESYFELKTGAVGRLTKGLPAGLVVPEVFTERWHHPLPVPDPPQEEADSGVPFWSLGPVDVSADGDWAVGHLNPNYPLAGLDTLWPVYLLGADGSYERMPLSRPAVFAETLGIAD